MVLIEKEVCEIEPAVDVPAPCRDEHRWDTSGHANGVLSIEVGLITCLLGVLRIGASIESLEGEGRVHRHVGPVFSQEGLFRSRRSARI